MATPAGADNWADAPAIELGTSSVPVAISSLTVEAGEVTAGGDRSAWWKVPAHADFRGTIQFDLSSSTLGGGWTDPVYWWVDIRIWRGGPGLVDLTMVEWGDWSQEFVTGWLDGRQEYYIQALTWSDVDGGELVLTASKTDDLNPSEYQLYQYEVTGEFPPGAGTTLPVVYGTPWPWGDGDISSYTITRKAYSGTGGSNSSQAWTPLPPVPERTVAIGWTAQLMAPATNTTDQAVWTIMFCDSGGSIEIAAIANVRSDGVAREYYGILEPRDFSGWGTDLNVVLSNIRNNGRVMVRTMVDSSSPPVPYQYDVYTYELTIVYYVGPNTAGQLYVNLSEDRDNPDWVSVCDQPGNSIIEVTPTSVYADDTFTVTNGWLNSTRTPTNVANAGDGNPSTYATITADNVGGVVSSGVIVAEFAPLPPGVIPNAMHMYIRARDSVTWEANNEAQITTLYASVGDSSYFDDWSQAGASSAQLGPLLTGTASAFDDYRFYYLGSGSSPSATTVDGQWSPVDYNGEYYRYYSLTEVGLRVFIFVTPNLDQYTDKAYLDIAEIKLVLSVEGARGLGYFNTSLDRADPDWKRIHYFTSSVDPTYVEHTGVLWRPDRPTVDLGADPGADPAASYAPAQIVGSSPQWGDQSTSSYARLETHGKMNPDGTISYLVPSHAGAPLPGLTYPPYLSPTITGNKVYATVEAESSVPSTSSSSGGTFPPNQWQAKAVLYNTTIPYGETGWLIATNNLDLTLTLNPGDPPTTVTFTMDNFPSSGGGYTDKLTDGTLGIQIRLNPRTTTDFGVVSPAWPGSYWARVYEAWVEISYYEEIPGPGIWYPTYANISTTETPEWRNCCSHRP